jgi:hypothetical protein
LLLGEDQTTWASPNPTTRQLIKKRTTPRDLRRYKDAKAEAADPTHEITCGPRLGAYTLDLDHGLTSSWNIEARNVFLQRHFLNQRPSPLEQSEAIKRFNTYFLSLRKEHRVNLAGGNDSDVALVSRTNRAKTYRRYRVGLPLHVRLPS